MTKDQEQSTGASHVGRPWWDLDDDPSQHGNDMGVSENRGTSKSSILIGISIINHPFWSTTIFGNTQIETSKKMPGTCFLEQKMLGSWKKTSPIL